SPTRRSSDLVVLTVGRIAAGTKDNIIGDTGDLSATLRTFRPETRTLAMANIERVAHHVASAHGLTARVWTTEAYPATINDEAEYELARPAAVDLLGANQYVDRPNPEMGSEDMSFVLNEVPGAYFFVSACPAEDYVNAPTNHSPRAELDDRVVPDAAAWYAEVALRGAARGQALIPLACGLAHRSMSAVVPTGERGGGAGPRPARSCSRTTGRAPMGTPRTTTQYPDTAAVAASGNDGAMQRADGFRRELLAHC